MKVIVTGGAGFIGGNFIRYMLGRYPEYRIICMDALTYAGNLNVLESLSNNLGFCFYKADISDRDQVFQIFQAEKPDILINFAAESHVDRSIEGTGYLSENQCDRNSGFVGCLSKVWDQAVSSDIYGRSIRRCSFGM